MEAQDFDQHAQVVCERISRGCRQTDGPIIPSAKPRVFAALPRYGSVEPESQVAVYVKASDDKILMTARDECGSALAHGFNSCWCAALNAAEPFDYWLLVHSDIEPHAEKPWLDVLIEELELGGFDVLHAVAAIKDSRGLTSTAIGSVQDQWSRVRRITTRELQQLPETFGYEDLLGPLDLPIWSALPDLDRRWCLLPNTGCMLVKLSPRWRRFPGFTMRDRIVAYYPDGKIVPVDDVSYDGGGTIAAQFAPEDWNFGRWCAQAGLKVGGTRKVRINHYGRYRFPSDTAWGEWQRDENFFQRAQG